MQGIRFTSAGEPLHDYVSKNLCNDEIEIDDTSCTSSSPGGTWVSAWLWVPRREVLEIGADKPSMHDLIEMIREGSAEITAVVNGKVQVEVEEDCSIKFETFEAAEIERCLKEKNLEPEQYMPKPKAERTIQYARMLAEINAMGLRPDQLQQLSQSMDLPPSAIEDVLASADAEFEGEKNSLTGGDGVFEGGIVR